MLTSLSIKNFALIEDISLQLDDGFSVITGETGAGKSILLGALSLVLGKRADLSAIRDSSKKCAIEAVFNIQNYQLKAFFKDEDLDYEPETIIRREILPSGKSRAFVNDTPVNLSSLQALGVQLVDIHSQHETLSLANTDYQFFVLDTFAETVQELKDYRKKLSELKHLQNKLKDLKAEQAEATKTQDYNLFLLEELEKAQLKDGMQEALEERQEQLSNVELLKEKISATSNLLEQEPTGVLENLREAKQDMQSIAGFSEVYENLSQRLQSTVIELEDIAAALEHSFEVIEDNPNALEETNAALQSLYNLFKKHQVDSVLQLLKIEEDLADKVSKTERADTEITQLFNQIEQQEQVLKQRASALHLKREKAIPKFIDQLKKLVAQLGMPDARFELDLKPTDQFGHFGTNDLQWQLSANKGGNLTEVKKAASGGELSRIMLSVKYILSEKSQLPTIIFDEIDTGVSGEMANKMAAIMASMAERLQVISITHLPQIAAKGQHHYKVYKQVSHTQTETKIEQLNENERIKQLAEMLGGRPEDKVVVDLAKSMLH